MHFGNLLEEFVVLAHDPDTDDFTIQKSSFMNIALTGAILLELILQGRLAVDKESLVVVDETRVDNNILDSSFEMIKKMKDPHSSLFFMRELNSRFQNLWELVLDGLVKEGIFEIYKKRLMFIFPTTRYKLLKPDLLVDLKKGLFTNIMESKEIAPRDVALLSLLYATNSATNVIPSDEVEEYIETIRGMVEGEIIGQSIAQSIHDIVDALMRSYIINFYSY